MFLKKTKNARKKRAQGKFGNEFVLFALRQKMLRLYSRDVFLKQSAVLILVFAAIAFNRCNVFFKKFFGQHPARKSFGFFLAYLFIKIIVLELRKRNRAFLPLFFTFVIIRKKIRFAVISRKRVMFRIQVVLQFLLPSPDGKIGRDKLLYAKSPKHS